MPHCEFCHTRITTNKGLCGHVTQTPACLVNYHEKYTLPDSDSESEDRDSGNIPASSEGDGGAPNEDWTSVDPLLVEDDATEAQESETECPFKRQKVTCEEVEDEGDSMPNQWEIEFPEEYDAGAYYDTCKAEFQKMREECKANGQAPWYLFASEEEWEMAQWLMTSGISQAQLDKYLKLRAPSFHNKRSFLQYIDSLPKGPQWLCQQIEVDGLPDANGKPQTEILDLWYRDPVECVKELYENPMFKGKQGYTPRWISHNPDGTNREFSKMWTGEWWWRVQQELPIGSTLCPVQSVHTQLTRFRGDKQAWPQFFHNCMHVILAPLRAAGCGGEKMACADGYVRYMMPILAAYIADYPEQCLVCCCRENSCPRCLVNEKLRGDLTDSRPRDPAETIRILRAQANGEKPKEFKEQNLHAIDPFWVDFPHCNIFDAMTPDPLHEEHNGYFDHVVKWSTAALSGGADELDAQFKAMSPHSSLRHFKKGISLTTQWTGTKRKEMEKVLLGILANATDPAVQHAVRCGLDFIYYSHFETHTEEGLELMDAVWAGFHADKEYFITEKIRKHFNINKLHKLKHYTDSIRSRGTTDGYSTEATERLHIDLAKVGYKATNKKAYIRQMTVWLRRQEAVRKFAAYLRWVAPQPESPETEGDDSGDDEDEDESRDEPTWTPEPATAATDEGGADTQQFHLTSRSYSVAKTPAFPRLKASQIANDFHATELIYYLQKFLDSRNIHPVVEPNWDTFFSVYDQITLSLPLIPATGLRAVRDRIKAVKAAPMQLTRGGTQHATAGRFDMILVRIPLKANSTCELNGLQAARVRVIFQAAALFHKPLAYIDWYTPFTRPLPNIEMYYAVSYSNMYKISRSQRQQFQHSAVIPISDIVRSCHLMPVFRSAVPPTWVSDQVLDQAMVFYLNPYLRHYNFYFFHYRSQQKKRREAKLAAQAVEELRQARIKSMGHAGRFVQ
ncbi:hypothetical protein GGX14DRAFT_361880 [Mycena pura]|uniref:Uncharacterized protein n=1 Tax=Mycena pura TaxID=153505 RepID=A0AAD6VIC6_9AGAR|nr:hypothetical protein GGX14DRAFT_361880 [Mycena pura]